MENNTQRPRRRPPQKQTKPKLTLLPQDKRKQSDAVNGSVKQLSQKSVFDMIRSTAGIDKGDHNQQASRGVPKPRLRVSIGTLVEIEVWAEKARHGKTRNAFGQVMDQIVASGGSLDDAVHSLTLAQIMPYDEMIRKIHVHDIGGAVSSEEEFVYSLSTKYKTSMQNVVDRIAHVRRLNKYYEKYGNDRLEEEIDD